MTEDTTHHTFFSPHAIRSIPWLIFGKVLSFFIYFSISIVIVRGLMPHDYGVYSICKAIIEYLVLFSSLGLNISISRFIPELMMKENLNGIKRLLLRTGAWQFFAVSLFSFLLYLSHPLLDGWLKINIPSYFTGITLATLAMTIRGLGNDISTSIYHSRFVTVLSICHSLIWLFLAFTFLHFGFGINGVLLSMAFAGLIIGTWNTLRLAQFFCMLPWKSSSNGIGAMRVVTVALPNLINNLLNLMMTSSLEIFFLGFYFNPTLVSYYDLGYQLPLFIITFIPLTLQTLFTSAFAEAYSKDHSCLPDLVHGYFQILICISVPIACFGMLFFPSMVEILYGSKMLTAGYVAAFFSFLHLCMQFSIPPSLAINAKEKMHHTLVFALFELTLAILLNYLLISRFGLNGALISVAARFFLTLPIRIFIIRRLIGGIYFPWLFFLKIFSLCLGWSFLIFFLLPTKHWESLIVNPIIYVCGMIVSLKVFRPIKTQDLVRFKGLGIVKLDKILNFFIDGWYEKRP